MNQKVWMALLVFAVASQVALAFSLQEKKTDEGRCVSSSQQFAEIEKHYESLLNELAGRVKSMEVTTPDTEIEPRYYRMFAPPTLYKSSTSRVFEGEQTDELYVSEDVDAEFLPLSDEASVVYKENVEKEIDHAVMLACVTTPQYFSRTEEQIMSEQIITAEQASDAKQIVNIAPLEQLSVDRGLEVKGTELEVKKPNFWVTSGSASLQFTQNYISGNWYKGGESTNTLISGLLLQANYNDKQKIQWDNTFEVKLGFTTAPSDTMHKYRTNTDIIRLSSKLGVQAIKSWYYTLGMDFNTQILRNYKSNSNDLQSAFMSPARLTVNVGMDYKKSGKNYNVSVNLSPLAYQWTYISDRRVPVGNFSVKKGDRVAQYFGSSVKVTGSWKMYKNISWTPRVDFFTNYEKAEASWENTFDFAVSKYLSTQLFLHARFDDGAARKKGYSYFQFKEFLSFGLKYNW